MLDNVVCRTVRVCVCVILLLFHDQLTHIFAVTLFITRMCLRA